MGCCKLCILASLAAAIGLLIAIETGFLNELIRKPVPAWSRQWWGKGDKPAKLDTSIKPFKINIPQARLADFTSRLNNSRLFYADSESAFQNGFNVHFARDVLLPYWLGKYNWRHWENKLNAWAPQFVTSIDGIQLHFVHWKAAAPANQPAGSKRRRVGLLLLHGWPGSYVEFLRASSMLREGAGTALENVDIDLVIPSLPGYGWSSAPRSFQRQGDIRVFSTLDAAAIMMELMRARLGYAKFYVQGGDWGSAIAHAMTVMNPKAILGAHFNMMMPPMNNLRYWMRLTLACYLPSGWMLSPLHEKQMLPFNNEIIKILDASGYMHQHVTRPDTLGFALSDSPLGLGAYLLEKFGAGSADSPEDHKSSVDGSLLKAFPMEDGQFDLLLTNVMVYWFGESLPSSMRLYKGSFAPTVLDYLSQSSSVPAGYANYPNEASHMPSSWAQLTFPNLIHYSDMKSGGHFAALEQPQDFASDLLEFLKKAENLQKIPAEKKTDL